MRTLRVADLEAKPGEKVSGFVHIIGADFGIPVTLICGEQKGETVLISGGVHNAEYVGIQAAMQMANDLDPKKITTEELGLYMAGAKRSVKNED